MVTIARSREATREGSFMVLFAAIEAAAERDAAVDRDRLPSNILRLLGA